MADGDLLTRIASAIDLERQQHETCEIRVKIAHHVNSLRERPGGLSASSIPRHIQGHRRRYLEAIRANEDAKIKLSQLQNQAREVPKTTRDIALSNPLSSHIEVLKLRRQHQRYDILSHYVSEAESIASVQKLYNKEPVSVSVPHPNQQLHAQPEDTSDLIATAQAQTRDLETILIQLNHKIQQKAQQLTELKHQVSDAEPPSNAAKLHALSTTRAELTRWIETSLSQVDEDNNDNNNDAKPDTSLPASHPAESEQTDQPDIDTQYALYISARQRLLSAISTISQLSPTSRPSQPHPPSQPLSHPLSSPPPYTAPSQHMQPTSPSILPQILTTHLPDLALQTTTTQYTTHIDEIIAHSTLDLASALSRLRDESHLLGSYPILADSSSSSLQSMPKLHHHQRSRSQPQSQSQELLLQPSTSKSTEEVHHLLRAWSFAQEAATTSTEAIVQKQCREAGNALDQIEGILEALQRQDGLWVKMQDT